MSGDTALDLSSEPSLYNNIYLQETYLYSNRYFVSMVGVSPLLNAIPVQTQKLPDSVYSMAIEANIMDTIVLEMGISRSPWPTIPLSLPPPLRLFILE